MLFFHHPLAFITRGVYLNLLKKKKIPENSLIS